MMYSKIDLIENKKMEKILRQNKYRIREKNKKRHKKEVFEKRFEIVFCTLFWIFITYFIYQVLAYLYVRL